MQTLSLIKSDSGYHYIKLIWRILMLISELDIGDAAKIVKLEADSVLKQRLHSFGIIKGAIATLKARSLAKGTLEIVVNNTDIGLRKSEADKIIVDKLESNNALL